MVRGKKKTFVCRKMGCNAVRREKGTLGGKDRFFFFFFFVFFFVRIFLPLPSPQKNK